jgi:formamidase
MELTPAVGTVFVDTFTDGLLDPERPMLGPVRSGGHIVANTSPCCWSPMITPKLRSGHEPTWPVAMEGAEVGDAIMMRIEDITVTSLAAASGVHKVLSDRDAGDPFILAKCPQCGMINPETRVNGVGEDAIRCVNCGAEASPFRIGNCYTMVFDSKKALGITVSQEAARKIAQEADRYAALPEHSIVNPFLTMAPSHMPGVATRLRPFLGQLGTTPAVKLSSMHNAGDSIQRLVGALHGYGIDQAALEFRTDAHMDCDSVRAGAILVCPVKVPGAGIYAGDMHAMQGDGEIAGHTTDVSGIVTLRVELVKNLCLEGPVLFPLPEDLPYLARPLSTEERLRAQELATEWGGPGIEASAPISFIGTGANLNEATMNGLERAANLLDMPVDEVKNRATITGSIEIARLSGVVQVTFLAPLARLDQVGLY